MNIEKDSNREAFEAWFESRYDANFMQFALDLDMYVDKHTQTSWEAWQAAKAQAVPKGFVLMPMVPSERMINAVRQCYEGEAYLPYSLYSEFVNQAIIERMEAQEPAND